MRPCDREGNPRREYPEFSFRLSDLNPHFQVSEDETPAERKELLDDFALHHVTSGYTDARIKVGGEGEGRVPSFRSGRGKEWARALRSRLGREPAARRLLGGPQRGRPRLPPRVRALPAPCLRASPNENGGCVVVPRSELGDPSYPRHA